MTLGQLLAASLYVGGIFIVYSFARALDNARIDDDDGSR